MESQQTQIAETDDMLAEGVPPPEPAKKRKMKDEPKPPGFIWADAGDTADDKAEKKLERKPDEGDGETREQAVKLTPTIKKMREDEEAALKDVIDELGAEGTFKIVVGRTEPPEVLNPATGKMINCKGYLETMTRKPQDIEDYLQRRHGGGLYHLKFLQRDEKGRMNIKAHRYLSLAGEPEISSLPQARTVPVAAGATAAGTGESEGVVKKAMDIMAGELAAMRERGGGGAAEELAPMLTFFQNALASKDGELAAIRKEMADMRNAPRPDDSFKETMIQTFVKDDGTRTQAVRLAYEAEIRALKEGFEQERNRMADRHERDLKELNSRHERDTERLLAAKNAEIAAINAANATANAATKVAQETQVMVYKSEISKLERDLKDKSDDLRVLKEKKDKGLLEQVKEIKVLKDALGEGEDDDDDEKKSIPAQILEALPAIPAAIQATRGMMGGQPPQQPAAQQPQVQSKRQVMKNAVTGEKFVVVNGQLHPVPKKPPANQQVQQPGGPQIPPIDPAQVKLAISFLETAYTNNTDPAVIAQSAKTHMSEGMLVAIRDLGVEQFLIKVGGVQMSSPLLGTLKGKNWIRQVAGQLVGEQ